MNAAWIFDFSPWRVGAAGALTLLSAWLSWRQFTRGGRRRAELGVEAVRVLAMLMFALTLLKPERLRPLRERERPPLKVLADRSGSMATQDVVLPDGKVVSRGQWVAAALPSTNDTRWAALESRFRIDVEAFPPAPAEGAPETDGTDLHAPLERLAREGAAPRAVLLLSDGDWNLGEPPVRAAARLAALDVPVFAVAVGAERPLPDIELSAVRAPSYALADEFVSIPFTARSFLQTPARVTALLLEEGIERARRDILLPPLAQFSSTLGFAPEREGDRRFSIRIIPHPDELRTDNNEHFFRMAIRREVINVLIVETEPRWEYRYLRNAAVRDRGVNVRTLLLHPYLRPGGGLHYLPSFPRTRDELSVFDVVFLGDVGIGPGGLTEEQAQWLRDLVESQASGLVFLPGPAGRWTQLAKSPLAPLLPIELEADHARGHGSPMEGALALTALGRDHLLTMLAASPEQNARVWSALPGFYWYAGVERARPGAEVLAVHAQARNAHGRIPLIVANRAGNGKVLFMGIDSAWRWRRGVEDLYHYRFWGQVFRWMAHQRRMAHAEGIRFFYAPENPAQGDRLSVQATPLDASGFPLQNATVEARLIAPSGEEQRFALRAVEGAWAAYEGGAPLREGGEYRLEVRCVETDRKAEVRFLAAAPTVEQIGRPARPETLKELAAVTRGRFAGPSGFDDLLEALRALPPPAPRQARLRLWCHPGWLAALTLVFGVYWAGRKGLGRV